MQEEAEVPLSIVSAWVVEGENRHAAVHLKGVSPERKKKGGFYSCTSLQLE